MKDTYKGIPVFAFFSSLFTLVLIVYWPTLAHPPRGDHMSVLYFFHHLSELPGTWLHVFNYDPWTQVRFYPLAHLIVYAQYLAFGADFIAAHLSHLGAYCILLVCLYRFARRLGADTIATFAFIAVFALLYSHSDIVSWMLHTYIIAGFIAMLTGYDFYCRFAETGMRRYLYASGLCFLTGMLCYETYVLWPLGVFLLIPGLRRTQGDTGSRGVSFSDRLWLTAAVYGSLLICFFLTRSLNTYGYSVWQIKPFIAARSIVLALVAPFAFLSYNSILVNAFPALAWPPRAYDEVFELAGAIVRFEPAFTAFLLISAAAGGAAVLSVLRYSAGSKEKARFHGVSFLAFLYYTELAVLFFTRSSTNPAVYIFQQFRYQMVPNALIALILAVLVSAWRTYNRRRLTAMVSGIVVIMIANIFFTRAGVMFVDRQIRPLQKLLKNVSAGLADGTVNASHRLYIDDTIVESFPQVCWNRRMAAFCIPRGTVQWVYGKKDIAAFAFDIQSAYWHIDPGTLAIKRPDRQESGHE